MLELVDNSKKVLNVFASNIHDKVDSWGPSVPGGFLTSYSSKEGLVEGLNLTMKAMKKTQLYALSNNMSKYFGTSDDDKKTMLGTLDDSWKPIEEVLTTKTSANGTTSYNWKDDAGFLTEWRHTWVF